MKDCCRQFQIKQYSLSLSLIKQDINKVVYKCGIIGYNFNFQIKHPYLPLIKAQNNEKLYQWNTVGGNFKIQVQREQVDPMMKFIKLFCTCNYHIMVTCDILITGEKKRIEWCKVPFCILLKDKTR